MLVCMCVCVSVRACVCGENLRLFLITKSEGCRFQGNSRLSHFIMLSR